MGANFDSIYSMYGYSCKQINDIKVYEYTQGRYFGVDILIDSVEKEKSAKEIEEMYRQQGYSTSIRNFLSEEELEDDLFQSFFRITAMQSLIQKRYQAFQEKQTIGMPDNAKYEYICGEYSYALMDEAGEISSSTPSNKSVIDTIVNERAEMSGPLLTIIEAAAGYGKTCTAYEIVNKLCECDNKVIPLYIELARNREARIFRHILQNEIDNQFHNIVRSEVVIHQIKKGRIPVIIDGFDELLSKDFALGSDQFRKVESMLNTIFEMLQDKANIIITSRKTAIFSGEEFYNWIQSSRNKFTLMRIALSEPQIKDWLYPEQIEILTSHEFPIHYVSNPVLLSYIRNLSIDELRTIEQSNSIVDKYFTLLLHREQTRQKLNMTNETQIRIFNKLARIMCEFDIKSESKHFIRDIIKDYNTTLLSEYIEHYPGYPKPTFEDVADTLSNHVLLDRKQCGGIGFINEFIFGTLIGNNLLNQKFIEHKNASLLSEEMAGLAILAYRAQSERTKEALWKALNKDFRYSSLFNFQRDIFLKNKLCTKEYNETIIEEVSLERVDFIQKKQFKNIIFSNCTFSNCTFNKEAFDISGFMNCKFYNCEWSSCSRDHNNLDLYFIGCFANNNFLRLEDNPDNETPTSTSNNLEQRLLESFIRPDGRKNPVKRLSALRQELSDFKSKELNNMLNAFKTHEYIIIDGDMCFIQKAGLMYYNKVYKK